MEQGAKTDWISRFRGQKLEMFSGKYYAACAAGGMVSAGTAHLLITPFDMLKVNMQANPVKYRNIWSGFGILWKEQGVPGLWRGWSGKLYGCGAQGACRFGFYEYFKKLYCDAAGPAYANTYKTLIYMAGSASAEAIADVVLCPFEAVKVRVQAQPGFAKGLADGFPRLYRTEGITGFYKGLVPLWGKHLPFGMIMFASFDHSVDFIYNNLLHKKKMDCSKGVQLGVTCVAGYTAGVAGSVVSNPADNIITYMYKKKGQTFGQSSNLKGTWPTAVFWLIWLGRAFHKKLTSAYNGCWAFNYRPMVVCRLYESFDGLANQRRCGRAPVQRAPVQKGHWR